MTVSIFRVSENGGKPHFTRRPKIKGRPRRAAWNKVKALCGVNGAFSVAVNIGRQRGLNRPVYRDNGDGQISPGGRFVFPRPFRKP